ncbi:hypothetical protein FRB90_001528 [Tulasnella sp. 427]|nr:hypothetical protein FRB90_001528 [Tulasnella sp. 427]
MVFNPPNARGGNNKNRAPAPRRPLAAMAPPQNPPMRPPPLAPASSYHTANTHAPTETDEGTQRSTQEEKPAEPLDPFVGLWGKLVPCNWTMETIDLRLDQTSYIVGRGSDANILISHPKISSKHCEIRLIYNQAGSTVITVADTSTNGTYVNGIRVGRGRHSMLNHGDELSLGVPVGLTNEEDFRFIFRSRSTAIERGGGIHSQYSLGEVLGSGSFATVKRAICMATGQQYAVKIIAKSKLQARVLTAEMVDAIQYTHRKLVMHRDLKPENVLLTERTDDHPFGRVKVADFGLAKSMADGTCAKTMCGTPAYLAPEVVLSGSQPYDFKVDCWSLGVIVWAMVTNTACFPEDDNMSLIERFQNRYVNWDMVEGRGLSDECIDFMQRMIVNDPRLRMSINEARNHPWLRGIRNDPPADWQASQQSQASQLLNNHLGNSQSEMYSTDYRGRTPAYDPGSRRPTPRISAENLKHTEPQEEITTPMETEDIPRAGPSNGYRARTAGLDGSGVSTDNGGSRLSEAAAAASASP